MKKTAVILIAAFILAGCATRVSAGETDIIEIGERFFITQAHHIYLNFEHYIGRVIRYEGIFHIVHLDGQPHYLVIRHTHGCCGPDGMIGFAVELNGIEPLSIDAWVEVTGVIEEYERFSIPRISAISITEAPERGRRFVE